MHDSGGKHIFIPLVFAKGFTSKVTQLVINLRCDVAGFSYEVFHDRIDQGIDSVGNTSSYAFVKDGVLILIFLDNILNVFLRLFCKAVIPPLQKFFCKSLNHELDDLYVLKSIVEVVIGYHGHMLNFV